jgi:hypothetical protein
MRAILRSPLTLALTPALSRERERRRSILFSRSREKMPAGR